MPMSPSFDSPVPGGADPAVLLDALQTKALERVMPALERALAKVDDYLFDRSQAGDDTLGLTALRDLRQRRTTILRGFEQRVITGFRLLRDPGANTVDGRRVELSLLSEEGLEEHLANEQLADSLTRLHAPALELLGRRIGHLVGRSALPSAEMPLSPVFLATALRGAVESTEIDAAIRIILFKFFERELAHPLAYVYERSNGLLVEAGILPGLRATTKAEPLPASDLPPPPASAGPESQLPLGHASPADQVLFANVLSQLQGWRAAMLPQQDSQAANGPVSQISSRELLSILSLMQRDLPAQLAQSERSADQPLARQLREEVRHGARKLGVSGDNLQLDGLDEDAVDLVALLFDVLLDGPQFDTDIRSKMGRMLVPYVKVAVKDRRMFLFKEHPARRLLNTVAEACEGNHGDAAQERELLNRVDATIERLVAEFNEDVAIFETLEQELRSYMAQNRKRFELAEKRTGEAQRGRERLEHARSATNALLAKHRGERELPAVMDQFLSRYASHHLMQVMLRDGYGSPRHEDAMQAVGDLLLAFDHCDLRAPADELPDLPRAQFEAILASSGCVGEEAQAAIDSLQEALVRLASGERAADNTSRMPEQTILPDDLVQHEPEPILEVIAGTDTLDFDAAGLARMRKLQVGHWIQLATSADRIEPAKVSWISPISGRLLLVNRRGIRVLVASPEELAAMAKLDKVVVREGETPFEDAMHQVAGRLRTQAGPV